MKYRLVNQSGQTYLKNGNWSMFGSPNNWHIEPNKKQAIKTKKELEKKGIYNLEITHDPHA